MEETFFLDSKVLFLDMNESGFEKYCQAQDIIPAEILDVQGLFKGKWQLRYYIIRETGYDDNIVYEYYAGLEEENVYIMCQSLDILSETELAALTDEVFDFIARSAAENADD